MILTQHAKARFQERGLRGLLTDIVMAYGRIENAPGGAIKVFLGKKEVQGIREEVKGFVQMLDRASGGTLILKDNIIITAYRRK